MSILDYTPALNANLNVDDTGNTFAGTLAGKYKVYIDPFAANNAANQYYVVGYKGSSPYDAGMFYCPYVPLQMVRAVGQTPSNQKLDSRLATAWSQIHSQKEPLKAWADSSPTPTVTTEESPSRTSCDPSFTYHQGPFGGPFFMPFYK